MLYTLVLWAELDVFSNVSQVGGMVLLATWNHVMETSFIANVIVVVSMQLCSHNFLDINLLKSSKKQYSAEPTSRGAPVS